MPDLLDELRAFVDECHITLDSFDESGPSMSSYSGGMCDTIESVASRLSALIARHEARGKVVAERVFEPHRFWDTDEDAATFSEWVAPDGTSPEDESDFDSAVCLLDIPSGELKSGKRYRPRITLEELPDE